MRSRPPDPLAAEKARLRQACRAERERRAHDIGARLAAAVLDTIPLEQGAVVSGYWPFADEADPRPLMAALHARGHGLCLPVTVAGEALTFRAWAPDDALVPGVFDTREPPASQPVCRPDCLLVPLLAVDREGYRLGYGGGFYDRTLATLGDALSVGLAFAFQRCEQVPRDTHDRPLNWLVTEDGATQFKRAA
jgi:5-formyltetrahydrofolate cyclo-ligase